MKGGALSERGNSMTLDDIVQDIHVLEQDLQTYERKYGTQYVQNSR